MTVPGLPVSRLVNVGIVLAPPAPSVENIDTCVLLGPSAVIDPTTRMRDYASITEVAVDFGTTAPEYLAAVLWFEQNPAPSTLFIARWVKTASPGQLYGGPLPALTYTSFVAITNGGFFIIIDGLPCSLSGLNFSSATNLNGVASIVQTGLQALSSGATVVWNATYEQFVVTSGSTGVGSLVSFASVPQASGRITFAGQPANNDTITLNGTVVTFVSGTPSGNQVQIGVSLSVTLNSLYAFLLASTDTQLVKFLYSLIGSPLNTVELVAAMAGSAGNALTLAKSGTNISISGATLTGGSGSDVSALMGLTVASSGAYLAPGVAAESCLAAVVVLDNQFSDKWYGLMTLTATNSDSLAVAAYVEASSTTKHFYGVSTTEGGCLVASDTSNIAYQLQQLNYKKTSAQYSSTNPYAAASLLARILTTDWQANNSTITTMYKQEPGIVPESLTTTQANALQGFNCNVFVKYNDNTAIIQYGTCASGDFIDTIIGMDWLAVTLQAAWYAALYETPTKIPQTDPGMHVLATIAENTCALAVNNGLLAPGVWNSAGFGAISQGSYLAKGFYVFQPSVNVQPQQQRAQRISVPFQIAVKLAGAVQTIDGTIFVNS